MTDQNYLFESRPHAVAAGRKKFRDQPVAPAARKNLMFDKRVVRGNTYAPGNIFAVESATEGAREKAEAMRRLQAQKRMLARKRAAENAVLTLPGRVSVPVQTDAYLEDLMHQAFQSEQGTQTDPDASMRRKPPVFKKKKLGVEQGTSIMPGDLFNFNLSIDPILEVIVGKCLDQGSSEVIQEQTLKMIKAHHEEFMSRKMAAAAESKRLATESLRRFEAKEKLLKDKREKFRNESTLARKAASRNISLNFVAGLQNLVLGRLEESAHLHDPHRHSVKTEFYPWLMAAVENQLLSITSSHQFIDDVVTRTIQEVGREKERQALEEQAVIDAKQKVIDDIEAERKRLTELRLHREEQDREFARMLKLEEEAIEKARLEAEAEDASDEQEDDEDTIDDDDESQ